MNTVIDADMKAAEERTKQFAAMLHGGRTDSISAETLARAIQQAAGAHNASYDQEEGRHAKPIWTCAEEACRDNPVFYPIVDFLLSCCWNDALAWCDDVLAGRPE